MAEPVQIPLSDLLFDTENPRLVETQESQQAAALELARQQGDNLLRLAEDIVQHGLDPTSLTAVVATGDRRKRYKVLEGNRRIVALRALETPSLISPALSSTGNRKLGELARRYALDPVISVPCVLFDTEEAAQHWIELRHTGQNRGIGLVEWGSEEKDRYYARHAGSRKPAGQVVEFVEKHGSLSAAAKASKQKILTNVERILGSPYAREKLGLDLREGQVLAMYPLGEVARSLTQVVEDLKTGKVGVPDLYRVGDRQGYVDGLPSSSLPKKSKKLGSPVVLDDLTSGATTPRPVTKKPSRRKKAVSRTTVIPKTSPLEVTPPRINTIFLELLQLNAEQYPNACSVLLRVFIELSVDHYLESNKLMTDQKMRETPLAKRLKTVVKDLEDSGAISAKLARAMEGVADGNRNLLAAPLPTFNQYVHNQYVFPRASDLYVTWDEVAPFMEKLWP
jgi:hypothetical protein